MARFFAVRALEPARLDSFGDADRIAETMRDAVLHKARLLPVSRQPGGEFVFGIVADRNTVTASVIALLREKTLSSGLQISRESDAMGGPFEWR